MLVLCCYACGCSLWLVVLPPCLYLLAILVFGCYAYDCLPCLCLLAYHACVCSLWWLCLLVMPEYAYVCLL
jgi:hypothetical protein